MSSKQGSSGKQRSDSFDRRDFLRTAMGIGLVSAAGVTGAQSVQASTGEKEWEYELDGNIGAGATVLNETAYVGDQDGRSYAINTTDGSKRWQSGSVGYVTTINGALCVVGDKVFGTEETEVQSDYFFARNESDGSKNWDRRDDGLGSVSPTMKDGTVYVNGALRHVARNAENGARQWRGAGGLTSQTIIGNTIYHGGTGTIVARDGTDGSEIWTSRAPNKPVQSTPTVIGDTVIAGSNDTTVYALAAGDGSVRWEYKTDDIVVIEPTALNGTVYIPSGDGTLHAIDIASGTAEWTFEASAMPGPATLVEDTLFVGVENTLHALDATDGTEQWTFEADGGYVTAPIVVDGTAYIGSGNKLYAVAAGVEGSSQDSRVLLGTLNHHHAWERRAQSDSPPPVEGIRQPRDLDDDDRYEDINGDGTFDIFDVQALFENLESPAVQNNPDAFNFSGEENPDSVDIFDVQALFEKV